LPSTRGGAKTQDRKSTPHQHEKSKIKKGNRIGMPGSRLSMGMATAAGAQASTGTEIAQANTEDEGDDSIKYRLAGLLGLLGLAGLLKRDRHDDHRAPGKPRTRSGGKIEFGGNASR
jgi:hypothetical protein